MFPFYLFLHLTLNWLITSGKSKSCKPNWGPLGSCPQFSKYCTHTGLCACMDCTAPNNMHSWMSYFICPSQWITLHTAIHKFTQVFTHSDKWALIHHDPLAMFGESKLRSRRVYCVHVSNKLGHNQTDMHIYLFCLFCPHSYLVLCSSLQIHRSHWKQFSLC